MLKIENVTKKFDENIILNNISLEINKNEVVTLLGSNGAGKTTLINCILKLYKVDSGKILFNGNDILNLKNSKYYKDISVVLESSDNVYDYLSGIDNIKYFMGLSKIKYKDYKDDLENLLKLFELENHIDKKVGNYSRGMSQKLAIIIALLTKPKLLILDEPTLGLDIKSKYNVLNILKELIKNNEMSILLTTHQMETIEVLNSKLLFLKNGKITEYPNIESLVLDDLEYEVKYLDQSKNLYIENCENMSFEEIYNKYKSFEIISIHKKEKNIEKIVMEKLDD